MSAQDILEQILFIHKDTKLQIDGEFVQGYCCECGFDWPCETAHVASGFGAIYECRQNRYCEHLNSPLTGSSYAPTHIR